MSNKNARSHHNISNRARDREAAEQKVVFKSALDSPFQVLWPKLSVNVQNYFLARVATLCVGYSDYRQAQRREGRKHKYHSPHTENAPSAANYLQSMDTDAAMTSSSSVNLVDLEKEPDSIACNPLPQFSQYLTIGINSVTKKLESLVKYYRDTLVLDGVDPMKPSITVNPQLVLVCLGDIDSPILVSHLPSLIAACNSARSCFNMVHLTKATSWLVPLPRGAEAVLAEVFGLKRVSVVSIDSTAPEFSEFSQLLESVPILTASWLMPVSNPLMQTHIKQIRTTTPKNMKTAREKRAQARVAAKQRRAALSPASRNETRKQRIRLAKDGVSAT